MTGLIKVIGQTKKTPITRKDNRNSMNRALIWNTCTNIGVNWVGICYLKKLLMYILGFDGKFIDIPGVFAEFYH